MPSHCTRRLGGLTLRETASFRLIERGSPTRMRYYIMCLLDNSAPRTVRVSRDSAHELTERISLREFDGACIMSGCGVFQPKRRGPYRDRYV